MQLSLFGPEPAEPSLVEVGTDRPPRPARAVGRALNPEQMTLEAIAASAALVPADSSPATKVVALPPIETLADVFNALDGVAMPQLRRRDFRSGVNCTGKGLGKPLEQIPASPALLARLVAEANPAIGGMTRYNWTKVRSRLTGALRAVGVDLMPGRDTAGLSDEWGELFDRLPTQKLRCGLSKMLSYFTRQGVKPDAVTTTHLEDYRVALATKSLEPSPLQVFNSTAKRWNEAATTIPGWPQIKASGEVDPRLYSLPWDAFPQSFRDDLEAYFEAKGDPDPIEDDFAPAVSEATVVGRKKLARQVASALVHSGFPVEKITGLAVLVDVENAKAALRYVYEDRDKGVVRPQHGHLAGFLCTVARYWVKVPEADLRALKKRAANLTPKKIGMRPKNRERLRQFDLPANQEALLLLPPRVFEDVRRNDQGGKGEAVRIMMAMAVEILIMASLRRRNITSIEVDRHLKTTRRGAKTTRHIVFPEEDTKTGVPIELALPQQSAAMLETYLNEYRARICDARSPYLFPGRGGALRSFDAFSQKLTEFLQRETGLKMNMHLFRHLAAKLHLDEHPEDIETVRRFLGHTSTRTTLKAYAELQNGAAFRRYDEGVAERRERAAQAILPSKKRKSKKGA